jgi:hypothetical protein
MVSVNPLDGALKKDRMFEKKRGTELSERLKAVICPHQLISDDEPPLTAAYLERLEPLTGIPRYRSTDRPEEDVENTERNRSEKDRGEYRKQGSHTRPLIVSVLAVRYQHRLTGGGC